MALVSQYGLVNGAGGAGSRANSGIAYTVPVGQIFLCTELAASTIETAGSVVHLTTGAGGGVAANDVAVMNMLIGVNPTEQLIFSTPIQFAAGTVVTIDTTQITGGAGDIDYVGFRGYTK
ncbi:MAG: hypothetical protein ABIH23_32550 [bacterium]